MGFFDDYFSYSTTATKTVYTTAKAEVPSVKIVPLNDNDDTTHLPNNELGINKLGSLNTQHKTTSTPSQSATGNSVVIEKTRTQINVRRFSFRSFGLVRKASVDPKPILSTVQEREKRGKVADAASKHAQKTQATKADKQALKSALVVRSLIVGPTSTAQPKLTKAMAKPQLSDVKSQLTKPKTANKVIAHLRQLPTTDGPSTAHGCFASAPIHAVCLEHTDLEEHRLHFSKLTPSDRPRSISTTNLQIYSVISAPLDTLTSMFDEIHVVDLIRSPDFGLGQPGNGNGLLAGALPTAETVINGVTQITPQLMALGYATGRAFTPDHSGIYPPKDRISVLTYWWGLEVLLPPPSLAYLDNVQSITGAVVNFLTALSVINNGVREILPFVRYIAQFIDFEFDTIKKQDQGEGVVCAATWIMPAAMVPRPWDFPSPPQASPDTQTISQPAPAPAPTPLNQGTSNSPRPIYSVLDTVASPIRKSPMSTAALATRQP